MLEGKQEHDRSVFRGDERKQKSSTKKVDNEVPESVETGPELLPVDKKAAPRRGHETLGCTASLLGRLVTELRVGLVGLPPWPGTACVLC